MAEFCMICGTPVELADMIVLEGRKIVCKVCAKKIAGAIGYQKVTVGGAKPEKKEKKVCEGIKLNPKEIKKQLDRFVVGQDEAKKILSVAAYNHYKRHAIGDSGIKKSNVLLIGPTGSGKTYLMETLAKIVDVPLAKASATNLTETGYVGDDVTSVLELLLSCAGGDIEKAEKGIVFIDEIDKLSKLSSASKEKVGGTGVQQALLPMLEGSKVMVNTGKAEMGKKVEIDTSGILFVCGGAFPEIAGIVKKRLGKEEKRGVGFGSTFVEEVPDDDILQEVINDDLKEFGFIPEFLGRLPILAKLHDLSVDTLKEIMFRPEDSIVSQFQALFKYDGVNLFFDEGALTVLAEKAKEAGTGARSLRKTMEELLLDLQFETPGSEYHEIVVTKEFAEGKSAAVIS